MIELNNDCTQKCHCNKCYCKNAIMKNDMKFFIALLGRYLPNNFEILMTSFTMAFFRMSLFNIGVFRDNFDDNLIQTLGLVKCTKISFY